MRLDIYVRERGRPGTEANSVKRGNSSPLELVDHAPRTLKKRFLSSAFVTRADREGYYMFCISVCEGNAQMPVIRLLC